jgi:hypothetical protein
VPTDGEALCALQVPLHRAMLMSNRTQIFSNEKARTVLGYTPLLDIEQVFDKIVADYKTTPEYAGPKVFATATRGIRSAGHRTDDAEQHCHSTSREVQPSGAGLPGDPAGMHMA